MKKQSPSIHLHWAWLKGVAAARGVTLAISLCGVKDLKPKTYTSHKADATCPACLAAAARQLAAAAALPPAPPAPAGKGKGKGKANGAGSYPTSGAAAKPRQRGALPNGAGTIKALTPRNPRKPGSGKHARMALLLQHNGKTVAAFLAAGGNPETLRNAIKENIVEIQS